MAPPLNASEVVRALIRLALCFFTAGINTYLAAWTGYVCAVCHFTKTINTVFTETAAQMCAGEYTEATAAEAGGTAGHAFAGFIDAATVVSTNLSLRAVTYLRAQTGFVIALMTPWAFDQCTGIYTYAFGAVGALSAAFGGTCHGALAHGTRLTLVAQGAPFVQPPVTVII